MDHRKKVYSKIDSYALKYRHCQSFALVPRINYKQTSREDGDNNCFPYSRPSVCLSPFRNE